MAMTAPPHTKRGSNRAPSIQAGSALPTRERRPGYVALAVVLIVGLAALGAWLYVNAGKKIPVIVMKNDVPIGQVIHRGDLTTASVAGGITAMKAERMGEVVGQTAAVGLLKDTVLLATMFHGGQPVAPGIVQLGIAVKPGQFPAGGLLPGDRVAVYQLPSDDSTRTTVRLVGAVLVSAVRANPAETGGALLTLDVQDDVAGKIAAAAAAGHITVARAFSA
jgi:hypothetical protein